MPAMLKTQDGAAVTWDRGVPFGRRCRHGRDRRAPEATERPKE